MHLTVLHTGAAVVVSRNSRPCHCNLIWSVAAEHVGFSIRSIWSVMVLFMPASVYGFSAGDKFLLGATATLVGA